MHSKSLYKGFVRLFRMLLRVADVKSVIYPDHPRVLFISNYRDEEDRKLFGFEGEALPDVLRWVKFSFKDVLAQLFMIGTIAEELSAKRGIQQAREQFVSALKMSSKKDVVLLGAGTKRIWGRNANHLRKDFPGTIFTIGDSMTTLALRKDVERAIGISGSDNPRVLVIGPSGFLGEQMVSFLHERGHDVSGIGSDPGRREYVRQKFGIPVFGEFAGIGKMDIVVACSHNPALRLTRERVRMLRRAGRRLIVVDVCEPPNFPLEEFRKCEDEVIRLDAGMVYSNNLHLVTGPIAEWILRLYPKTIWGCFGEALVIAHHLARGENKFGEANWMEVSEENIRLLEETSFGDGRDFTLPPPMCFGKKVRNLDMECSTDDTPRIAA